MPLKVALSKEEAEEFLNSPEAIEAFGLLADEDEGFCEGKRKRGEERQDVLAILKDRMQEEVQTMNRHSNSEHPYDLKKYHQANGARRAYEKTISLLELGQTH